MRLTKRYKKNFSYRLKKYSDKVESINMVDFSIYNLMKQIENARILYYDLNLSYKIYGTEIFTPEDNKDNTSKDIVSFGIIIYAPTKSKTELTIKNKDEIHKIYYDIGYYRNIAETTKSSALKLIFDNKVPKLIEDHVREYREKFKTPESLMKKYKKFFGYINNLFSKDIEIFGYDEVEMIFKFDKKQIPEKIIEIVGEHGDYKLEKIIQDEKDLSMAYFIYDLEYTEVLYLDENVADLLFTFTIVANKKQILKIENMPCFVVPGFVELLAKSIRWD